MSELFDAALDQPQAARAAFLQRACGDDPDLLRELAELLLAYGRLESADAEGPATDALVGTMIGAYRVQRLLGKGGMGRVYLASRADGVFEKDVAVKIANPQTSDDDVLARFAEECRILASLQHPNIARLLDAGRTPDKRLYFIMEYVDGEAITVYCERHQVPVLERLRLMLPVCDAVALAHRNLIVHRDLKPANILVDVDRQPRLLDFGIAKALTRAGLAMGEPTHPLLRRATRGYASPEQLRGDIAHTGMDVFALGVILHELVTGLRPAPVGADAATGTGVGDYQAPSMQPGGPFVPNPRLAGLGAERIRDLDAIILKALAGDPKTRYSSVQSVSQDLSALLEHRPVSARTPTAGYRTRKFVRRNAPLVATAAVAALAVVAALVSLSYLWQRARTERAAAVRRFEELHRLSSALFAVDGSLGNVPGATAPREALAAALSTYLSGLRGSAQGDPAILMNVAESYRRLGDVQGNPNGPNLGDTQRALASYAAGIDILQGLRAAGAPSPDVECVLADTLASRGDVLSTLRDPAQAGTAYREALDLVKGLTDTHPDVTRYAALLARIQRPLGDLEMAQGRIDEALASYEAALAIELKLARVSGSTSERQRLIALTRLRTADARARRGQWRDALAQYSEAIETLRSMQAGGAAAGLTRDTAVGLTRLAAIVQVGDHPAAAAQMREAIALFRQLAASDAADARVRRDLYLALVQYGDLLLQVDVEGARGQYQEALTLAEGARTSSGRDDEVDREVLLIRNRLAAGPAAVAPSLRLSAVVRGQRVLLGPGDPVPRDARGLVADAKGPPGWLRYVVLFGAEGDATVLDERQLEKAQWTLPLAGPPPAQTVLLVTVPRPLTDAERQSLTSGLSAVPGPRAIDWDSRVVWTSEEREPRIVSTASARGAVDTGWIKMVRARLSSIPAARFTGQTFPIAAPGS